MRKKELFKRLTAISMAAMMTLTMMPSYAFASDSAFQMVKRPGKKYLQKMHFLTEM